MPSAVGQKSRFTFLVFRFTFGKTGRSSPVPRPPPKKPVHVSRFWSHVWKNRSFVARPPSPVPRQKNRSTFHVPRSTPANPVSRRPSPVPRRKNRFTFHAGRHRSAADGRRCREMGDDDRARKRPVRAGSEKRARRRVIRQLSGAAWPSKRVARNVCGTLWEACSFAGE